MSNEKDLKSIEEDIFGESLTNSERSYIDSVLQYVHNKTNGIIHISYNYDYLREQYSKGVLADVVAEETLALINKLELELELGESNILEFNDSKHMSNKDKELEDIIEDVCKN